jgi:hypothetical protein
LWSYCYDAADELTCALERSTEPTPTVLKRYAYAYDRSDNRVSEHIDVAIVTSTYDTMNRLDDHSSRSHVRIDRSRLRHQESVGRAAARRLPVGASFRRFTLAK